MQTLTGCCKYCGQVNAFKWADEKDITEAETEREATLACNCEEAKYFKERDYKITAAVERLSNILDNGDEQEGQAFHILEKAIPLIYDQEIYSISINVGTGVKVDLKRGKEGQIKIKRQEVETREETV